MAWLRIDDGFAQHPKIVQLSAKDRWTWLELLCYCARYRTEGHVPEAISEVVRGATPALLERCVSLRLLEVSTGRNGYEIHDWADFNPKDPTKAARQARWRHNKDSAAPVDADVDADVDASTVYRDGPSRAGSRARSRPVPSPSTTPTAAAGTTPDAAAALLEQLDDLGLNGTALELALEEPDRAQAWINLATTEAKTNPSGFVLAGLKSKAWPATRKTTTTHQTKTALQMTRARQRIEDDWHTLDQTGLDIELTDLGIPHADRTPLYELAERVRGERCPPS